MSHGPLKYHVDWSADVMRGCETDEPLTFDTVEQVHAFLDATRAQYPSSSFKVFYGTPVMLEPRALVTTLRVKGAGG